MVVFAMVLFLILQAAGCSANPHKKLSWLLFDAQSIDDYKAELSISYDNILHQAPLETPLTHNCNITRNCEQGIYMIRASVSY
jgi:hypothetical protein